MAKGKKNTDDEPLGDSGSAGDANQDDANQDDANQDDANQDDANQDEVVVDGDSQLAPESSGPLDTLAKKIDVKKAAEDESIDLSDAGYSFEQRKKNTEDTAATIALILVWILAGTIVIHYTVTTFAVFSCADEKQLDAIERIFNTLLPVISGLVGSAVAYYLGRERRLKKD